MRTLEQQLSTYAAYHRDRRNIATHFVGVPMIVIAVFAFAARPWLVTSGVPISAALLLFLGASVFYAKLDLRLGLVMAVSTGAALRLAMWLATESVVVWLAAATSLFVVGWVIQLVGHAFEGRKPAFVDDLVGLLIGPLFIVCEAAFALGLRQELREVIESNAGPTYVRRSGAPLPARGAQRARA